MQSDELKTLVEEIHRQRTEKQTIELKTAHTFGALLGWECYRSWLRE